MHAIEIAGFGGPDVLRMTEIARPIPMPGQILVEVAAAGVNRPDCLQRRGGYPPPAGAPATPGLEIAGTVVGRGDGSSRFKLGDEVCALVPGGGYAEFAAVAESNALPVPAGLSLTEAAALPETYFTVWTNVFERGGLKWGETFLVHGGSSGIGSTAIQLARAFGAGRVITTVGSAEKAQFAVELGADLAINYREQDFAEVMKAHDLQADVTLDMVGGSYVARNMAVAALGGRIVQIAFQEGSKISADFTALMVKRLTYTGSTLRPRSVAEKAHIAHALKEKVWPLLAQGRCKPHVFTTFPLAEAAAAHHMMESGAHMGKIVLVP
ncbi:MAG: NAD(P)H-quinone oxidoreductase [Alphaproteobacteria bacterium]|nr:NAD(P)H-quinone oxidoreductase [Alphaproteobacteria bacterium]